MATIHAAARLRASDLYLAKPRRPKEQQLKYRWEPQLRAPTPMARPVREVQPSPAPGPGRPIPAAHCHFVAAAGLSAPAPVALARQRPATEARRRQRPLEFATSGSYF